MPTIKPTPGRVVWYYPAINSAELGFASAPGDQPLAAIVAFVWSDSMVNLTVFDANGAPHSRTSVQLVQDVQGDRPASPYCTWMPYQKDQAAKAQAQAVDTGAGSLVCSLPVTGTLAYTDGTTATGVEPLPEASPAQQDAAEPAA